MSTRPRLVIIGIDAATWDLMDPWLEAGELPNIASIISEGCRSPLRSIVPPSTACAWPAIMTGANPGKSGMFFFVTFHSDYVPRLVSNANRRAPALWDILSQRGLSVGVYNVPMTYPPDRVNGYMVSGEMGAVGYDASMFQPAELFEELSNVVPRYEIAPVHRRPGGTFDLEALKRQVEARRTAAAYLLQHYPTDVFMTVINYVDHLQHRFFTQRQCGDIEDILLWGYRAADEFVGEVLSHCGEETNVMILSDHGAGPVDAFFDLNALLARMGYLSYHNEPASHRLVAGLSFGLRRGVALARHFAASHLTTKAKDLAKAVLRWGRGAVGPKPSPSRPASFQQEMLQRFGHLSQSIDWSRTRAYSAGPYLSIRLNLKGREQQGQVEPHDYKRVRDQLIAELNEITNPFSGKKDLNARATDELYEGEHMQWTPDILGVPQGGALTLRNIPGSTRRVFSRGQEIWPGYPGSAGVPGTHRMTGIFACKIPGRRPRIIADEPTLLDIAPTALALLSLPPLREMDGRVLLDLPEPSAASACELTWTREPTDKTAYTAEEAQKVEKRLRDLGYL